MTAPRLDRLRSAAGAAGLDALAVVPGPNLTYLTGLSFHLSERPTVLFVPTTGTPAAVVPALEAQKAGGAPFDLDLHLYDDVEGPRGAFGRALEALDLGRRWLGIEGRRMRFLELDLMARSPHAPRIFDAAPVFATLRMTKDAGELAHMRRAASIAEAALGATLPAIGPGATEREIAAELTVQLLRAGSAPELPFAPIVAAGPNAANPHAVPTDRPVAPGDLVLLDWGAAHAGYLSDITRTFAVAGAALDPALRAAYDAVRAANAAGRAAVRPGATGADVDGAARAAIEAAGLGERFIHRTGHGLGLEGHEEPDMKAGQAMPLAPGMTFTIEPGVYLPGVGGVRIEDDVVVTEGGGESLTSLPRELRTLG